MVSNHGSVDWRPDPEGVDLLRRVGVEHFTTQLCEWVPPHDLSGELPEGIKFVMRCAVEPQGLRRFYPVGPVDDFIARNYVCGLAVLSHVQRLDADARNSYRAMWLILQKARTLRERFKRHFHYSRDLFIRLPGRESNDDRSILPASLGFDGSEHGSTWTIRQLVETGEQAARAAGIRIPTRFQCIQYGLIAAAEQYPLDVPTDQVPSLVRSSLFDLSDTEGIDQQTREVVLARILRAIDRHLDDSSSGFRHWFLDPHNSVLLQLAKQKGERGAPLAGSAVRKAILDIGWDAYYYMRNCLSAQMQAFSHAIDPPLTALERDLFTEMHLPQPYFGDLPLLLLVDRLEIIAPVLWRIWGGQRQTWIRVLHRLLQFYAEMAVSRRRADRRFKPRVRTKIYALNEQIDSPPAADNAREVIRHICDSRGVRCSCHYADWSLRECSRGPDGTFNLTIVCQRCGSTAQERFSSQGFAEIRELFRR